MRVQLYKRGLRVRRHGTGVPNPLEILGSSLLLWVEVGVSPMELAMFGDETRIARITDLSANAFELTEAAEDSRPLYSATGGPRNRSYAERGDASDTLSCAGMGIAAAALKSYVVRQTGVAAQNRFAWRTRNAGGDHVCSVGMAAVTGIDRSVVRNSVGATQTLNMTAPLPQPDVGVWHLFSHAFDVGVAVVCKRDGSVCSPAHTVTGIADAIDEVSIFASGTGGGVFYMAILADFAADAPTDAAIRAYIEQQTGIAS